MKLILSARPRECGKRGVSNPQVLKMVKVDPILAVEMDEAKAIIAAIRPRPLTIQERIELLTDRMAIDADEAHELVYLLAGWRRG